ncbi:MAG: 50S ribosomal protein L7/L12 [Chloroflexi bacterium]|nr:50S ribosomal protein L7/L12 [Chloroflexota bacterium]
MATISKDDILSAIDSMTVVELSELVEALKEKYNVTGAPMAMAAAPAADGANGAAAEAEQTEFTVHLESSGQQKIQVIKAVREITGLGLREAKGVVDAAPGPVKEGVSKDEGDQIVAKLAEVGATAELR